MRNALVEAGVSLAREGGPSAVVLREAARRVGVSPNAAYRHFAALPELLLAVCAQALAQLGHAMQAELARCPVGGDASAAAVARLRAVGRAYVYFALHEPGLFTAAFAPEAHDASEPPPAVVDGNPYQLLNDVLDELAAAGAIAARDREAATTTAWAGVHGLSLLLLGPLRSVAGPQRDQVIEECLGQILTGVLAR